VGLTLRVSDKGYRSYVLIARFPLHPIHPTRRTIGQHGQIILDEARETARDWLRLIRKGVDPKVDQQRQRAEAQRSQANSFAHVVDQFLERHAKKQKKYDEAKRVITKEFVHRWGPRPVTDIRPEEVAAAIREIVKRGQIASAHNAFSYIRRVFSWAIGCHEFGLETSPCDRLKPNDHRRGSRYA
jgi:hypothetical protein